MTTNAPIQYREPDSEDRTGPQWTNVGGARALVDFDTGEIMAGCPGLEGEDLDDIGEGESPESRERREQKQERAEAAGWESQETKDARETWRRAKEAAPAQAVALIRVGDTFYTFDEDAQALFDATRTGDGKTASFDADKLDYHLGELVEAGQRAAVVDSSEHGHPQPSKHQGEAEEIHREAEQDRRQHEGMPDFSDVPSDKHPATMSPEEFVSGKQYREALHSNYKGTESEAEPTPRKRRKCR